MVSNKTDFQNRSIEKVKRLWHLYILGEDPQLLEEALAELPEDILMIGTGMHEFYQTRAGFLSGMSEAQIEGRDIKFQFIDEWYEVQEITETVCVVYGSIWAQEKVLPGQTVFVDMQGSRFTIVCHDSEQGVQICSVHHSMPYMDQGTDEYYPKTLSSLARELEKKAEQDRMTELYSRYYMEQYVTKAIGQSDGFFLTLDLDNFKSINDTKGHLIGDQVIREFASIFKKIASPTALLGRMGGDEFAVWDAMIHSEEEAEAKFDLLLEGCKEIGSRLGVQVTCSAGIVFSHRGKENFSSIYRRADQALYRAKALGKTRMFWGKDNAN